MKSFLQMLGLTPEEQSLEADRTQLVQVQVQGELVRALCNMVIHAWKARQRLLPKDASEEPGSQERRLLRHLDAILDEAKELGITVKDRINEVFDYGLPDKVVASEPQAGLSKPIVKETLRPTIFWNGQILVHGEVVIATPQEASLAPP